MTPKGQAPLLIEIGCEELPPKSLKTMMLGLVTHFSSALKAAQLGFDSIEGFSTPRRLAVRVNGLESKQPTQQIERRGPSLKAAYDTEGNPSKALAGFLRSCQLDSPERLETLETDKGSWLVFKDSKQGLHLEQLLAGMMAEALAKLPIDRRMHWGRNRAEFVRPVQWLVALHGKEILPLTLFGIKAGNKSRGHRFMANKEIPLQNPDEYESKLAEAFVIVSFEKRQLTIVEQLKEIEKQQQLSIVIDTRLLDEVTALVEWPVALLGKFSPAFLNVPEQALISAMKEHQRYFHIVGANGSLLPMFVTIANIESENPATVISGNERVIRPRLSDADFFFQQDLKTSLDANLARLETVVFQKDLGSYHDKAQRIAALATYLAEMTGANPTFAARAGLLCKSDLVSNMVGEFPDLQGIMGAHYARHHTEPEEVCIAIQEHYQPTASGSDVPASLVSKCVAIADKLDTLTGLFGVGQPPTGSRDPFALRRQTIGIIRMCVEGGLAINIRDAIDKANALHAKSFTTEPVAEYFLERLKNWYQDNGIRFDTVIAILQSASQVTDLVEVDLKINALEAFRDQPESESLIAANKRVANILKKVDNLDKLPVVNQSLFIPHETMLFEAIRSTQAILQNLKQFPDKLLALSGLQAPLDEYFEAVMVMTEDSALKANRLATLLLVRQMCLDIADLSLLQ